MMKKLTVFIAATALMLLLLCAGASANTYGIGGGYDGNGGTVTISGGTVTATGGDNAAGIGSGDLGNGGIVNIYGGTVTATGARGGFSKIRQLYYPYDPGNTNALSPGSVRRQYRQRHPRSRLVDLCPGGVPATVRARYHVREYAADRGQPSGIIMDHTRRSRRFGSHPVSIRQTVQTTPLNLRDTAKRTTRAAAAVRVVLA